MKETAKVIKKALNVIEECQELRKSLIGKDRVNLTETALFLRCLAVEITSLEAVLMVFLVKLYGQEEEFIASPAFQKFIKKWEEE